MATPHSILKSLTDDQRDQVYDWLQEMTAKEVVAKLARPAPEGFGLNTHITTVQRFKHRHWVRQAADRIEDASHLATIAAGHDATLDIAIASSLRQHLFQRASAPAPSDADLAQLVRWVDRQERLKLDIQRVQISRERLAQSDQRILQGDKRIEIAERAVAVKELEAEDRCQHRAALRNSNSSSPQSDQQGPFARTRADISERVRLRIGISKEEAARRAALRKAHREAQSKAASQSDSNPAQAQLDSNLAQPQAAPLTAAPAEATGSADFQAAVLLDSTLNPLDAQCDSPSVSSTQNLELKTQNLPSSSSALSASSAPSALSPSPSPEDLAKIVDAYTIRRAEEYWAHRRQWSDPGSFKVMPPEYITQYRHCPCGNACPCPIHEDEQKYGQFPDWFWNRSPHSLDYAACLESRDLPYRDPKEFLA